MGVSVKTLSRILSLHDQGLLKAGASIIELGAQELHCTGAEDFLCEFIRYFAKDNPALKEAHEYSPHDVSRMANKGMMNELMRACGLKYSALDIFEAPCTILFDLNIHEVGEELFEKSDLVTNFGTTEHVINQFQAMKTIHNLTKPGGLIYHDLPHSRLP